MNPKFKKLIEELSIQLIRTSHLYLLIQSDCEQETADLIDLVISSHLTSMSHLIESLAKGNNEIEINVKEFINKLSQFISNLPMITKCEFMDT